MKNETNQAMIECCAFIEKTIPFYYTEKEAVLAEIACEITLKLRTAQERVVAIAYFCELIVEVKNVTQLSAFPRMHLLSHSIQCDSRLCDSLSRILGVDVLDKYLQCLLFLCTYADMFSHDQVYGVLLELTRDHTKLREFNMHIKGVVELLDVPGRIAEVIVKQSTMSENIFKLSALYLQRRGVEFISVFLRKLFEVMSQRTKFTGVRQDGPALENMLHQIFDHNPLGIEKKDDRSN